MGRVGVRHANICLHRLQVPLVRQNRTAQDRECALFTLGHVVIVT